LASEGTEGQPGSFKPQALSAAEQQACQYLMAGYSEPWTAETLGLETREARRLFSALYKKLGVTGPRALILNFAPNQLLIEKHGANSNDAN